MKKVLIIGAGALGQQITHYIATDSNDLQVVGYVDDWAEKGTVVEGIEVLGGSGTDIEELYKAGIFDALIIGIGYKYFGTRKALYDRYVGHIPFATFIHSTCYIDPTATLGAGCVILPRCVVDIGSVVEPDVLIYSGSVIGHNTKVGAHSIVSLSVTLCGFSEIDERCFVGAGATIIDNKHIAADCLIGAGAVVTHDVPEGVMVAGVPARVLKTPNTPSKEKKQ